MKSCRVLVIEDELLVGMDIVTVLESAGVGHVEHAATEEEALRLIQTKTWDAVMADANLYGRSIEQVATILQDQGIPFVVLTGYDRSSLPQVIGNAPVLSKPFSSVQLVEIVQNLCTGIR